MRLIDKPETEADRLIGEVLTELHRLATAAAASNDAVKYDRYIDRAYAIAWMRDVMDGVPSAIDVAHEIK